MKKTKSYESTNKESQLGNRNYEEEPSGNTRTEKLNKNSKFARWTLQQIGDSRRVNELGDTNRNHAI